MKLQTYIGTIQLWKHFKLKHCNYFKVFPRARDGVAKIAVIIVDGQEDKDQSWRASVLSLRKAGVRIVLVGVGPGIEYSSFRPLVENDADLVVIDSFAGLLRNSVGLTKTTCDAAG